MTAQRTAQRAVKRTAWPRRAAGLWLWLLLPAALAQGIALPRLDAPLLLLGEVHDNAAQHALRLQALQAVVDRGARPALLLEMFDREHQAAIDAVQQAPAADATATATTTATTTTTIATASDLRALDRRVDALIDAAGRAPGWHWPFYRPYLRLALQHRLPIVAANVSRADARLVIQQGLGASGFTPEVPVDIDRAQARAIEQSHCGAIDPAMATRLARAQVARDQFMARLVVAHAERGVVLLLAGNGHVRRDIGVPRWLPAELRRRSHAVGYLEGSPDDDGGNGADHTARSADSADTTSTASTASTANDTSTAHNAHHTAGATVAATTKTAQTAETAAYDESVFTPPQPRADPCASLRPLAARPTAPAPPPASR